MKTKNFSNEVITHNNKNGVEYITFKALDEYKDKLLCFQTLRHGGVSEGVYNSLNLRLASGDLKENVISNLKVVCKSFNLDYNKVYKARQDHTDSILVITGDNKDKYEFLKENDEPYDGIITKEKNIATIITTADCNPIVIYDTKLNIVANIHSGWKGTLKRIYLKALDKMKEEYGTDECDVIVCIFPSIGKCCFSSEDENFKKLFENTWNYTNEYIYYEKENPKRFHIDLPYVITKDFIDYGVKKENIYTSGICTMHNNDSFFSYRSKTKKNEPDYGCMGTFAVLI